MKLNWKAVLSVIGGPLAGALGMWLASDFPAIYRAMCLHGGG